MAELNHYTNLEQEYLYQGSVIFFSLFQSNRDVCSREEWMKPIQNQVLRVKV